MKVHSVGGRGRLAGEREVHAVDDGGHVVVVCVRTVVGGDLGIRVAIEAGVELGWHKYIGIDGIAICMEGFGHSAPAADLAQEFGFTVDAILERLISRK